MKRIKGSIEKLLTRELIARVANRYRAEHPRRRSSFDRFVKACGGFDAMVEKLRGEMVSDAYKPDEGHWREVQCDGKTRKIFAPSIRDAIASASVAEVCREYWCARCYPHQFCNRRGMGTHMLARKLGAHLRHDKPTYYVKLDVKKCFDSLPHNATMAFLARSVKDPRMLRLIWALLVRNADVARGLPIGGGLSQYVANGILTPVYSAMRACRGVWKLYAYMDDVILTGGNKRKLLFATRLGGQILEALGMRWKRAPQVHRVEGEGVDLVGLRQWGDGRRRLRRKIFTRACRAKKLGRVSSYFGWAKLAKDERLFQLLSRRIMAYGKQCA